VYAFLLLFPPKPGISVPPSALRLHHLIRATTAALVPYLIIQTVLDEEVEEFPSYVTFSSPLLRISYPLNVNMGQMGKIVG
jgi:hypothetical protein